MLCVLEVHRTCYTNGNAGTWTCPRGATAHGCSFAPVTTLTIHPGHKFLASLMSVAPRICHRRTHPADSRSCAKDSSFQTNCLCKRCNESHSNVLKIRLCMPWGCASARSAGGQGTGMFNKKAICYTRRIEG